MFFKAHYHNLEHMLEGIKHFDLDFVPLDSNPFYAEVTQVTSGDMLLKAGCFRSNIQQFGTLPYGFRTFVIPCKPETHYWWLGHEVDGNTIQLFPSNQELNSITNHSFEVITVSFSDQLIEEVIVELDRDHIWDSLKELEVWKVSEKVRDFLVKTSNKYLTSNSVLFGIDQRIYAKHLLKMLLESMPIKRKGNRIKRATNVPSALKAVIDLIRDNPNHEVLNMGTIVERSGVSERTLQYAFLRHYSMTPMQFYKNYRIQRIRKRLQKAPSDLKIIDIAAANGFYHMGQFSSDFKKFTGQLPSQVLKAKKATL